MMTTIIVPDKSHKNVLTKANLLIDSHQKKNLKKFCRIKKDEKI